MESKPEYHDASARREAEEEAAEIKTQTGGTWIHSDHYHCKACDSAMLSPQVRLEWALTTGVRRVGVCKCGQILVEREHGWPRLNWKLSRA